MFSNPELIFYVCIAKGSTILAEFISSNEEGIEVIAQKCVEKTPSHHSAFSHTASKRTYTFLINDPFAYFLIFHRTVEKSESFWVLNSVKIAFEDFIGSRHVKDINELSYNCFQGDFDPVFRVILSLNPQAVDSVAKEMRNSSMDSTKGKGSVWRSLLAEPAKFMMMIKKKENNDYHQNVSGNGIAVMNREFSVSMHKNGGGGGFYVVNGRQRAMEIWRKQALIVLTLDLVVCVALFGIWLWICDGFKCIDG